MRDARKLEMLQIIRDMACSDIRTPQGGSMSAQRYVDGLNRRVVEAQRFMTSLSHEECAQVAFKHWQDVFKPDAVLEGWDIRLMHTHFDEFQPVSIITGAMSDTVVMNLVDGRGDHHSAAREFLYGYSRPVFELVMKMAADIRERVSQT